MMIILYSILMQLAVLINGCSSPNDAVAVPQDPASTPPETQPQLGDEATAIDASDPTLPAHLDALLDRLENSARDLRGFTARIDYEKYDDLLQRREIRSGELLYRAETDPERKSFAILFDQITVNRRRSTQLKHYIFDGRWLAEIDHESDPKQFIKRELVAPGQTLDPLKLGEGPIPLPIGQKKQDVLDRFEVEDVALPEDGRLAKLNPESVTGIRLVPKPDTSEADEFTHIDLFYDLATNLPVGIEAVELNGDRKTVRLSEVVRNPDFTDEMLAKLSIVDPDPREWKISIQSYADTH